MSVPTHRTARHRGAAGVLALAALAALAGCGSSSPATTTVLGESANVTTLQARFVAMVDAVSPAVVQIQSGQGLGSGVTVTLPSGKRYPATLVGTDPSNDLAVIHINGATPPAAAFAESSKAGVGDIVLAIGNPLGLQSSVSQGIVSSLNRTVSEGNGVTLSSVIQTSAEINPGNSGGALVDLSGRVLGIPTLAALDPEFGGAQAPGIGFAIPSDTVRRVADRLIAQDQA